MNEFIITIDQETDRPWHYRTTADKVVEIIGAFQKLGKRIINVKEVEPPKQS